MAGFDVRGPNDKSPDRSRVDEAVRQEIALLEQQVDLFGLGEGTVGGPAAALCQVR